MGVPAAAKNAITVMNKAKVENKEAVVESKALHNRIVKMEKDIEKSQNRLKNMHKKQTFMVDMSKEKQQR